MQRLTSNAFRQRITPTRYHYSAIISYNRLKRGGKFCCNDIFSLQIQGLDISTCSYSTLTFYSRTYLNAESVIIRSARAIQPKFPYNENRYNLGNRYSSSMTKADELELAGICERAEEIKKLANQSINSSQSHHIMKRNGEINLQTKLDKLSDLETANKMAKGLIQITNGLKIPLNNISTSQYSILHGSFLSVTSWLLHLLSTIHENQFNENIFLSSHHHAIIVEKDQEQKQLENAIETLINIAHQASYLKFPLHLLLYTQLMNTCVQILPNTPMATSAILQLCSSLHSSFPTFDDWEGIMVPLFRHKIEACQNSYTNNQIFKIQLGRTCQEVKLLLEVTQREYHWKMKGENALILLKTLMEQQQQQYKDLSKQYDSKNEAKTHFSMEDSDTGYSSVLELTQVLLDPIETMLQINAQQVLKHLSHHGIIDTLLQKYRKNEIAIPEDILQFLLEQHILGRFSEDVEDIDDDDENRDENFSTSERGNELEGDALSSMEHSFESDTLENALSASSKPIRDVIISTDILSENSIKIPPSITSSPTPPPQVTTTTSTTNHHTIKKATSTNDSPQRQYPYSYLDMIYFRDDFTQCCSLPDITSQLIQCNQNKPVRFTKEYEEELIQQLSEEEDDDNDGDDDDDDYDDEFHDYDDDDH